MINSDELICKEGAFLDSKSQLNRYMTQFLRFSYLYFLIRFKLNYRQTSIITHSDFDGLISGAIVLQKIPRARVYFALPRTLHIAIGAASRNAAPNIAHTIYILDLSVSETYQTRIIKAIKGIRRKCLVEIYWIDHHQYADHVNIRNYVHLDIDPQAPHAALIIQKLMNNPDAAANLIGLLYNADTPFCNYWRDVLRTLLRNRDLEKQKQVLHNLAKDQRTDQTDALYKQEQERIASGKKEFKLQIFWTKHYKRFGIIEFYEPPKELYVEVRTRLRIHGLDFLLVLFDNGTLSAYKSKYSSVDLTPLFSMVAGKGHAYAFHFDPQVRESDEFFHPITIQALIEKIQEMF